MNKKIFNELIKSVKQIKTIVKTEKESIYDKKMKNPKFAKLMKEGYKEMTKPEQVTKTYDSVDVMLEDMHKNWTWLDYLESYWHRYFWNYVSEIPLYIKRFWQRGCRGWADCDVWSFDYYLGIVISQGIEYLLMHGNCAWTSQDLKALHTIQKTFETVLKIYDDNNRYIPSNEFTWKEYRVSQRFYKKMAKKYHGRYHVMTLRESKKFEQGFDLFREYYFKLWD